MRPVALYFVSLTAACAAFAQAGGTGPIEGTVTDPSSAAVAGATVAGFQTLTQSPVIVDALATVGVNPKLQIGAANCNSARGCLVI